MATVPSLTIPARPTAEMAAAEALYLRDLPGLLETKLGWWVAYSPEGCIAEGKDELALFEACLRQGHQRGRFLVARVEPDAPAVEITESWSPLHASARIGDAPVPEGC